jgi:hypothetical protein
MVMKIRDSDGNVQEILVIKGKDGKDYVLTAADKEEIANIILPKVSGAVIREVTELPTSNVTIGAIYKKAQPKLIDLVYFYKGFVHRATPYSEHFYYVATKPTENIAVSSADGSVENPYYVEDENDVFFYIDGVWTPFSALISMPYKGTVTNAADAIEEGYYAVIGTEYLYYEYVNEVDNVVWVRDGTATKISELVHSTEFYTIPTKTTEGVLRSNASSTAYVYYIEDENDVFLYNAEWRSLSYNFGTARGEITDIADATENGYYILRNKWRRYEP